MNSGISKAILEVSAKESFDASFGATLALKEKKTQLEASITAFSKGRVLVVGDVMLDEYLIGNAERISPEAPVPVVRIGAERRVLGGAGNVARNITSLGGTAILVGMRGNDTAGEQLAEELANEGIVSGLVIAPSRPTTIKSRILAHGQQMIRFDRESVASFCQIEREAVLAAVERNIEKCDAVIISDYGKGMISEEFMEKLCESILWNKKIPLLADPKPQNIKAYKGVTLLTPNAKEAGEAVHLPVVTEEEAEVAGKILIGQLQTEHMVITRGADGMAVFVDEDTVVHIPTTALKVFDVTGAGDTVIATMGLAMATGSSLVDACMLANYAAGIVVGEVGAAVCTAEDLRSVVVGTL